MRDMTITKWSCGPTLYDRTFQVMLEQWRTKHNLKKKPGATEHYRQREKRDVRLVVVTHKV